MIINKLNNKEEIKNEIIILEYLIKHSDEKYQKWRMTVEYEM